jgi:hypothetical protein
MSDGTVFNVFDCFLIDRIRIRYRQSVPYTRAFSQSALRHVRGDLLRLSISEGSAGERLVAPGVGIAGIVRTGVGVGCVFFF